ncbi:MAG: ELWxxDGT repeat protein [Bacteroidota bacterium]
MRAFFACFLILISGPAWCQIDLVKDINPSGDSYPQHFMIFDGKLYFCADDHTNGYALWNSDGTANGTYMIRDFHMHTSSYNGHVTPLIVFNNKLYLEVVNGDPVTELWVTNGTDAGTALLKSINANGNSHMTGFTEMNGSLYFAANDGTNGTELWKSNGIPMGTLMLKDINGSGDSDPANLTVFKDKLYFSATDEFQDEELWVSDGSALGTSKLKDLASGWAGSPHEFTVMGDYLYFAVNGNHEDQELWRTDGTTLGTTGVADIFVGGDAQLSGLTVCNDELYFAARDGIHGVELWKTDGTAQGTVMVRDIYEGPESSWPDQLYVFSHQLWFRAQDQLHGFELWSSDGTADGTTLFADLVATGNGSPHDFITYNRRLVFVGAWEGNSSALYSTQGVPGQVTIYMPTVAPNTNPLGAETEFAIANGLLFPANYNDAGSELYKLVLSILGTGPDMEIAGVSIGVFPNPARESTTVRITGFPAGDIRICLTDLTGKTRMERSLTITDAISGIVTQLELTDLPQGVYLLSVNGSGVLRCQKVIVE